MTGKVMVYGREFDYALSDNTFCKNGHMVHILELKENGMRIAVKHCKKFSLTLGVATQFMNGYQEEVIKQIISDGYVRFREYG